MAAMLKRLWGWVTARPPSWMQEVAKMKTGEEVLSAVKDPEWCNRHGIHHIPESEPGFDDSTAPGWARYDEDDED